MRKWLPLLLVLGLIIQPQAALAQTQPPDQPTYIIQSGDTLYSIAIRFGMTIDALTNANPQIDPNNLKVGDQLVLPGLEGISGVITAQDIQFGDSLTSLSRRFQIPENLLVKLNHITSPSEVFVGGSLILPQPDPKSMFTQTASLGKDETLLELAAQTNANPWTLVQAN